MLRDLYEDAATFLKETGIEQIELRLNVLKEEDEKELIEMMGMNPVTIIQSDHSLIKVNRIYDKNKQISFVYGIKEEDYNMSQSNKVLVGTFNEEDLKHGRDKIAVNEAKEKHGLKYTETKLIKKKGEFVGIKIWVCDLDTFTIEGAF